MKERGNKTIMCSVLFLDIVEYSKKPVSGQIALKESFNTLLAKAIRSVPLNDRIILDTGDGAAISFLGDVEDALNTAMQLRAGLLAEEGKLPVRMGINLGPVRLVKDINGQPNIVGDGINVAQRVMGFADPGQILVSRSYYDAVSRLSHGYVDMFHHQGSRTDKHVREHEIYAIGYPGDLAAAESGSNAAAVTTGTFGTTMAYGANGWRDNLRNTSGQQRAVLFAAVLALLVVLIKVARPPAVPAPLAEVPTVHETASAARPASAVALLQVPPETATAGSPEKMREAVPHEKEKTRKHTQVVIDPSGNKIPISRIRTLEETTAVVPGKPTEQAVVISPGPSALVSIAVTPWGEVYLDGKMQGVSPPLAELQVAPGDHEIEIRNTTFPVYKQDVRVKAGDRTKITHKF